MHGKPLSGQPGCSGLPHFYTSQGKPGCSAWNTQETAWKATLRRRLAAPDAAMSKKHPKGAALCKRAAWLLDTHTQKQAVHRPNLVSQKLGAHCRLSAGPLSTESAKDQASCLMPCGKEAGWSPMQTTCLTPPEALTWVSFLHALLTEHPPQRSCSGAGPHSHSRQAHWARESQTCPLLTVE